MPGGRTCAALEEFVEFSAVGMTPVMVDLPEIVAPAPPLAWTREAAALVESIRERAWKDSAAGDALADDMLEGGKAPAAA
jgi:hypothetical protein